MSNSDLRHPEEWEELEGIRILDADGWRNTSTPWDMPISYEEFLSLAADSTIERRPENNMGRLREQTRTLSGLVPHE